MAEQKKWLEKVIYYFRDHGAYSCALILLS